MKKLFRIIGILIAVILLFFVGLFAYINIKPLPNYSDVAIPDLNVPLTAENLALGQKLIYHNCTGCHAHNSQSLEGGYFVEVEAHKAFGTVNVPNITTHPVHGIGSYSDGELYRLFRTGVKRNGKLSLPIMPHYTTISDEDIYAMIAFLRSEDKMTAPSDKQYPPYQPSMLAKGLFHFALKPSAYKEKYLETPSITDSIAYGEYLVNHLYGCYGCHSQGMDKLDLDNPTNTPGYLAGGTVFKLVDYEVLTPGILMNGNTDVSSWTIEQFTDAIKYGPRPNKPAYKKPMHPYNLLDTAEVHAIYHYIKSYSESL